MQIFLAIGVLLAVLLLVRVWTGALNVKAVENETLAKVERQHPYLPRSGAVIISVLIAGLLFVLSLKYGQKTSLQSLMGAAAAYRTIIVFTVIVGFGFFEQMRWRGLKDRHEYFYAFVLGTLVTWILIAFKRAIFETGTQDPFLMALGVACIVVGWRFLFGPWNASIKATVLGTFLFWVIYALLRFETREILFATGLASVVAFIPVAIWCWLFLGYHKQRLSIVILAFFSGMLSTAPILFYSALATRSTELNFFIFKIMPLSYGTSSRTFVADSLGSTGNQSIVLVTLVTYMLVGVIEEISKFWVLEKSSKTFFRSIDDVLQLAIIVALGFAFAENLINPTYFVAFVRDYLLQPQPQWGLFFGSVMGRAVLTTMVHVLSTGVLGYFFGLAFYASPVLRDRFAAGKLQPISQILGQMFGMRTDAIFARTHMIIGLVLGIVLHGLFDFVVSLPDVLPGNPSTVGALLGVPLPSFLHNISITLLPSVLYVVGGFWILTALFERAEDMKEYGLIIGTQTVVTE